jgi:hypothetical protein
MPRRYRIPKISGVSNARLHGLVDRWAAWVDELEDHPLDTYEYLGALECRSEVQEMLALRGDESMADAVNAIDSRFEDLTITDGRIVDRFPEQSDGGWWWRRLPKDPLAQGYILQDW